MDIEKPIRDFLRKKLENDFIIYEKCKGYHRNNDETVFYDLVLKPEEHLIQKGFHNGYFIIEVKMFNKTDKVKYDTKFKDMLWQCIVYSYSDIIIEDNYIKPLFVLYYLAGDHTCDEHYHPWCNYLHFFVQRGGVGTIKFMNENDWEITFGSARYYSTTKGKGPFNVGVKRMTGSSR
jgi:hypothetical protein